MWIGVISANFKELLETLKARPHLILIILLMFSTGYFINREGNVKEAYDKRLDLCRHQKDSIQGVSFDRLLIINKERDIRDIEHENMRLKIKKELEEPIKKIKENVERYK